MFLTRRVVVTGCLLLVTVLTAFCWTLVGGGAKRINIGQSVHTADQISDRSSPTDLKIAIAAMISPATTKRYYEDLMRLVGSKVGRNTALVQRKTYAEINALVENRTVDLAFVCAGPYVAGHEKFGMEIIAIPVVDGAQVYHSYVLVNSDGGVKSFDELRGKRFAFTDPDSNTGFLVPTFMLAQRGETPTSFFRETIFTHSHDNSIRAVAEGVTDGAAVDSLIWEFLKSTNRDLVAKTVIIHKSPPYGIPPVVVHPNLDPAMKARLKLALLSLHEDAIARPLLRQLRIDRFEAGEDALYQSVREMQAWLTQRK